MKSEKHRDRPKNARQDHPWAGFLKKKLIFGDSGVPGRSLGKALGRILGGKFGDEKKVEKMKVKP